jgi:hypothetical protein
MSLRCWMAVIDHQISAAAATGPKAWSWSDPARSPLSAEAVARLRKHVGHGMPVMARSGQEKPGSAGCRPLSQR